MTGEVKNNLEGRSLTILFRTNMFVLSALIIPREKGGGVTALQSTPGNPGPVLVLAERLYDSIKRHLATELHVSVDKSHCARKYARRSRQTF